MRFTFFMSIAAALILSVGLGAGASTNAWAAGSCSVSSPPHRVALVELYTSEGCSSCPPADNWLSELDRSRTTSTVVPLALHVDYWDTLGWKDPFDQPAFTTRQQRLSEAGRQHTVYTPEVFVDGRELRAWSDEARFGSTIRRLNEEASPVDIHVDAHSAPSGRVMFNATFHAAGKLPDATVAYVAVYENGIDNHVQAGENSGATLHHDRVVRQWIGPVPVVDGHAAITGEYSNRSGGSANSSNSASAGNAHSSGVVAFVENQANGEVLQVSELPACAE
ncbi:thioredoxin family protein [Paraburkholderia sp. DHOC27]|uniref:DUF1223 domain-containing protein n=1 Tax=Paraburkholderia sp. DHOC27 TaxID=2303330 RepID=UPI000E3D7841|nr:DUF1223 domain-containing protein [Paraburkholderia sp. DHOC27]RFU45406.1 DUF1223 domain-containing protein [Paraburkholderia sp. DHOC27]